MTDPTLISILIFFLVLAICIRNRLNRSREHVLPLPPGPKGLPLLGNIRDLPQSENVPEWQHWLSHKDAYGPISSLTVLGKTFVILNSADITLELLKDRAAIHSGRPSQQLSSVMIGWDKTVAMQQPHSIFKQHRKNIAKVVGSVNMLRVFDRVQEKEAAHFLLNLMESPDKLFEHIRKEAAAVVAQIVYGYVPEAHGSDPLIDLVGKVMEDVADAAIAGKHMVDLMPILQYLPEWFPGASFKIKAREMKQRFTLLTELPLAFVKKQMRDKKHRTSYISQAIEESGPYTDMENIHKHTAISLYAGGADTTVSSLMTFFLAMMLFPDVQTTAQNELDRVIGNARLPVSADKDSLPYIHALIKETHRWHPVAPMGLAHMSLQEDSIRGYRIPKNAILLPNTWWFTHDPAVYPDPMIFRPERHLSNPPPPDPRTYTFGYGRRSCPGRYVADAALFITIAQVLAVFRISKARDDKGVEIEPAVEFEPGLISHPRPYRCRIVPRSEGCRELVGRSGGVYPWEESDREVLEGVGKEKGMGMEGEGW